MKRKSLRHTRVGPALVCLALLACGGAQQAGYPWPGETWPTSTPAAEGIDPAAIDELVADIEAGEYGLVDAFMLIRHGKVVADHRFEHDYATIAAAYDPTNHPYNYDHPDWHPYLRDTDLLEASDEWIRFVLEQPTDTTPGTRFEYNDGVSVLLGKVLREATGQRIDEWARERLFEPIGITEFYWKITPDGEADTEGGLYLSTEDLARVGYLFLREGEWNGQQIISREWVEASTAPVVPDVAPDNDRPNPGYGYQWWILDAEDGATRVFAGNGYGGQFVLVVPEYDIVAVFNGWNIHGGGNRSTIGALQERILPHVDPAR